MDKFEKDLIDLENAYYLQLLPPYNEHGKRTTMLNIILEYTPCNYYTREREVGMLFHAGSTLIRNDSFFILKRDGYKKLCDHAAFVFQKYIKNSKLDGNVIRFPLEKRTFEDVLSFFETDNKWQIEWITKWEIKNVMQNNYDLVLNVDSIGFKDGEISQFFAAVEQNLKKHFTVF